MSHNRKARTRARRSAAPTRWTDGSRTNRQFTNPSLARTLRCERLEDRRLLALITVDTVVDTIDFNDGKTSLREAIFAANIVPGADEIAFDTALFAGGHATILLTHGDLVISESLTIDGPGATLLSIDASGSDPTPSVNNGDGSRVFQITGIGVEAPLAVSFVGMRLVGGDASTSGGAVSFVDQEGTLTIANLTIEENYARSYGGGVFASSASPSVGQGVQLLMSGSVIRANASAYGAGVATKDASAAIADSTIENNRASGTAGGGVYFLGGAINSLAIVQTGIRDNSASLGSGGGVYLQDSFDGRVRFTLDGSRVENNSAVWGGGMRVRGAHLVVNGSTIANNQATGGTSDSFGGGIDAFETRIDMTDSTLAGNSAKGRSLAQGGGIWADSSSELNFLGSTVSANEASVRDGARAEGGGVFGNGGPITIFNSTFSGNRIATTFGPQQIHGSAVHNLNGRLSITRSTFSENLAPGGGAAIVIRNSRLTLDHSIIGDPLTPPPGPGVTAVNARFSLIKSNQNSGLNEAPPGSPDANGNLIGGPVHGVIDPLLGPLADNGGPTLPGGAKLLTHALLQGSPAIGAGDPALAAGVGTTPEFDQRGAPFSRVIGRIDIGSVESIGAPILVDTLVDESDGDFARGDLSLREAIELANAQPGTDSVAFDPALFAGGPRTILLTHGELAITDSTTIVGPGADVLTIDASGNDPTPEVNNGDGSRIFNVSDGLATKRNVAISHVAIMGGDVLGDGGAILTSEILVLDHVHVRDNSATRISSRGDNNGAGGGIASFSELTLRDSIVAGNQGGFGGGLHTNGSLNVERSEIAHNKSVGPAGAGGGIHGWHNNSITISNSSIHHNEASIGTGGIRVEEGSIVITDSSIAMNRGTSGGGLGVRLATTTLLRSTVSGNYAGIIGAGVWLGGDTNPSTILDSTISGNVSDGVGGGIGLERRAYFTAARVTVTDNRANADGIGIGRGGGISGLREGFQITHSIVTGNFLGTGQTESDVADDSGAQKLGNVFRFSVIGFSAHPAIAEAPVGAADSRGNLIGGPIHGMIDPKLGPLADNGGPMLPGGAKLLTHELLAGSPAIDAGDPALAPGVGGTPEFDQRGAPFTRLTGTRTDIGAVEAQAANGALGADFNFDGQVDGDDFLVWQRGVGKTGLVTLRHGDATANGVVDANDLAVWAARYGDGGDEEEAVSIQLSVASNSRLRVVSHGAEGEGGAIGKRELVAVSQAVAEISARDAAFEIGMRWSRSRSRRR